MSEDFPRPSIIVGSTNLDEFLADSTGNRRYWVVPIYREVPLKQLAVERDRIWAAAVHAYRAGEQWMLPPELRAAAQEDVANYASTDPWDDYVLDYVHGLSQVTVKEVLTTALKLDTDKLDKKAEMRVASILQGNRWERKLTYVDGRRVRIWNRSEKFGAGGGSGGSNEPQTQSYQIEPPIEPPLEGGGSGGSINGTTDPPEPPLPIEAKSLSYSNASPQSHLPDSMSARGEGEISSGDVEAVVILLSEVTTAADLELLTDLSPSDKARVWAALPPGEKTRLQALKTSPAKE